MSPRVLRLTVCAVAFVAWLGYLGWQVLTRPLTPSGTPLVLSRPQLLVSDVDIIADIPDPSPDSEITVKQVLHGSGLEPGEKLTLPNLKECRAPMRLRDAPLPPPDWSGPGEYLVPLKRVGEGKYEVALIPPSPGYDPQEVLEGKTILRTSAGPPRIYPATAEALAQYRRIKTIEVPGS